MARGEERAAGMLYDRFGAMLYAVAIRLVGEPADAEEVVADAFAQAWRDAPGYDPSRGSTAAWLTMIVRSRGLDLLRAGRRRVRATDRAVQAAPTDLAMGQPAPNPAAGPERSERRARVHEALAGLPAAQREAIELAFYQGLSQSEIAHRLDQPLGTIKTRVRLAMAKLRDQLEPYYFGQDA